MDGNGRLNLWNLNNDTELPSATVQVDGPAALNRVSWTQSGLHVTAGDDMGKIWVYDVGEVKLNKQQSIGVQVRLLMFPFYHFLQQLANPRPDDWSKFAKTLAELKNNQTGDDLDQLSISSR